MSYSSIAIQLGDTLKYETTVTHINRTASALLPCNLSEFPTTAITSVRAQGIYNWVLSLARHPMPEEDRHRVLIRFALALAPESKQDDVRKLLVENGIPARLVYAERGARFDQRRFHSEVVGHARGLFSDGHYFHAVFEAAKAYNKAVKEKAEHSDDGVPLMMAVWGCDKGTLKITRCQTRTDRDVQDGIKFLSAGLMQAIRNPTAHEPANHWPIDEQDCLDILSFISFLFRKLDMAVRWP